jgi:hypothetical protein
MRVKIYSWVALPEYSHAGILVFSCNYFECLVPDHADVMRGQPHYLGFVHVVEVKTECYIFDYTAE